MSKKLSCIIIDDDKFAREILEDLLLEHGDIEVLKKIDDSRIAIKYVVYCKPDIIFMDINMPEKTGLDVLDEINELQVNSKVIFITAHEKYVMHALRNKAADYILKPVNPDELYEAINRIRKETGKAEDQYINTKANEKKKIMFRNAHSSVILEPDDIYYIEADGCYSKIHINKGVEIVTKNIGKIEEQLSEYIFFRISRSTIINLNYLLKIDRIKKTVLIQSGNGTNISIKASRERLYNLESVISEQNM
jgi:two-component system LytT family response regulator